LKFFEMNLLDVYVAPNSVLLTAAWSSQSHRAELRAVSGYCATFGIRRIIVLSSLVLIIAP
jgi:hypothetical protein